VLLKAEPGREVLPKVKLIFIKAENYYSSTSSILWKLQRLYTRNNISREEVTHTLGKLDVNPMKMRNTTAKPCSWSTTIRILCVNSRKKMKCKSLEVITCFIILLDNTHIHTSLNPKI
jgi:hypothetical protein